MIGALPTRFVSSHRPLAIFLLVLPASEDTANRMAAPAVAQTIPQSPGEVAKPGGHIPASPKLALVKIADGLNDPVGISVANDGSGRVRRACRPGSRR